MPLTLPIYLIDSFTDKVFKGNPAAVCPLENWLSDQQMLNVAAENNLSETVFFVKSGSSFHIRWFTPTTEVDLCGHATLAAAKVLFDFMGYKEEEIIFTSISGDLKVIKDNDKFVLNFPVYKVQTFKPSVELLNNFSEHPVEVLESGHENYIVVLKDEEAVRSYIPDFNKLMKVDRCINITAKGNNCDFVSRYFGPNIGIPEDPVTGSAHCGLAPYWAEKLNKFDENLNAIQVSKREGELICKVVKDRVYLSGNACLYLKGEIHIS